MRRLALVPLAISMLLFSPVASALGLGEIEMQSALNQRLDAEIPLRGVPEDDSSRIIVSLASEEAFRQVGLQRPFSLTRLSFAVKQHDSGGYYIHVTSREPIVEPFLSFLIEVDWPDGNLLREYTVLLDPPVFVSDEPEEEPAPAAGADVPAAAAEDESMAAGVPADIERDAEPEAAAEPEPEPEPEPETTAEAEAPATEADEAMAEESRRAEGDFSDTPVFLQVEQAEERAEAEARAMAEAEQISEPEPTTAGYDAAGDEYGPVQRGEALWNIASRLKRDDMTVQQMMLALLRYNPEAFVNDNINRLRQGYVLRIPEAEAVLSLSAQQAVARVREQNALWQEYRRALRGGTGPAQQQASADGADSATVAGEDADLRIVGSEEGTGAGSDQDASATAGSGQSSEQLQMAREQLESARMEKAELESRVGELEETVGKMERLIELREDELARLQDQLRRIEEGADPAEVLADADAAAAESAGAEEMPAAEDDMAAGETGEQATDAADETETAAAGEEAETDADAAAADADDEMAEAGTGEAAESDETAAADADDEEAVGQADDGTAQTAPATDGDGGVTTVRTQPSEPGILDQVSGIIGSIGGTISGLVAGLGLGGIIPEPFVLPAVGAIVVLLLLGAMLAVRRSRTGLEEEAGEEVIDADAEAIFAAGGDDTSEDFSTLFDEDDTATADDIGLTDSLEAEASELAGGDEGAGDAEAELMSESFDLEGLEDTDETMTAGAESADDDTIAEADVYLAYGLHQQAEDLLNLAIEEQPDRADYRAKLLEAIYGGGRSEDFVEQARALRERVDDTENDPNWLRVVAMGQELAPNEELFQQEIDESLKPTGAGAAQPLETDLDLGGDDDSTDLDFSFDDEEGGDEGIDEKDDDTFAQTMMVDSDSLESHESDAGLAEPGSGEAESGATEDSDDDMDFDLSDFDLGAEDEEDSADDATPAAEAPADEAGSADFDLSDFDLGDEDEAGTPDTDAEAPAGETTGEEDALADFDLGDLEDAGESGEGAEEAVELGSEAGDFDFDLGEEDADESPAGEADAGPDAGEIDLGDIELEDESDSSVEGESATGEDEDAFDFDLGEDTDLADVDLGDLEDSSDTDAGEEDTGEELSLEDADEDVSLDDLAEDLSTDDSGLVGPDTGEAAADTDAADDAGQAAAGGDAGGDEDEYRTMLDLARAYIDMGDAESARSALEEVVESGSAEQRSEAQGLLDSI